MTQTILVVDDDRELRDLVKSYLVQEGFRVVTAADGREALFVAREEMPDLIVLDLMMPEMGGHDFIRIYNKEADIPIILLTARLEESDKVLGLELGADDYVTKPFSLRELTARIRAVLRRAGGKAPEANILRAADIVLDVPGRVTIVGEQRVDLTPSEFSLLAASNVRSGTHLLPARAVGPVAGPGLPGLRAYHRRSHPPPAHQDRARSAKATVRRDGIWLRLSLRGRGNGMRP